MMGRLLVFNFDGTGNEPEDADQKVKYKARKEDDNITNVLKLHLMLGGNLYTEDALRGESTQDSIHKCFYYQGVGTYGKWYERALNQGLALEGDDVATILNVAKRDFYNHYENGDLVLATGFSRGAALARRFVSVIGDELDSDVSPFVFLCVFDTVASIGLPNLSKSNRPDSEVVFENGCTLSPIVVQATHLLSLDDKRKAFQPTLMNYEPDRILELWFAGAHSDVGGGYYRDGLSDIALSFATKWMIHMQRREQLSVNLPKFMLKLPEKEELKSALPGKLKGLIQLDDLQRNPDPMAKNHQQDRWPVFDWLTLEDREFCVIEKDKISEYPPILHWSVPIRLHRDSDYRPKSLKGCEHLVWYDFENEPLPCDGMQIHIHSARMNWLHLDVGQEVRVSVDADHLFNHSGVMVEKGECYQISACSNDVWFDRNIECNAEGWSRDSESLGLIEFPIALAEKMRRVSDADWFALCCAIGTDDGSAKKVGMQGEIEVTATGELTLFANDLTSKYGNNSGYISVKIKRIA